MIKKRKHHYVWKHYLKPWVCDNQVVCLRDHKIFKTSLVKIANKHDFYRLKEMSEADITFLRYFFKDAHPLMKNFNENWITIFTSIFEIRNKIIKSGISNNKLDEMIDILINNLEEDYHSCIESMAIKYIDQLRSGQFEFYSIEESNCEFNLFICIQYFRTENRKEKLINGITKNEYVNIENIWNVLRHIMATNMAALLSINKEQWELTFLKNDNDILLITGDQPVINLAAKHGGKTETLELYYPISPTSAIIIKRKSNQTFKEKYLSESEVLYFNNKIKDNSYQQIYALKENDL